MARNKYSGKSTKEPPESNKLLGRHYSNLLGSRATLISSQAASPKRDLPTNKRMTKYQQGAVTQDHPRQQSLGSRKQRGQLKPRPRKSFQAPTCCASALPYSAPSLLSLAPLYSLSTPSCSLSAPSMLPLKRPYSLSRPGTAISNPKFGEDIVYIYISAVISRSVST